ncbi:MAG: hypothetical protein DMG08_13090 [Acidobacteria bacterium]|nr:MAG: hypothetical protein DMG08_13080 [Acidobacteriota bacterium]PYU92325.1 MAG: hypothetical protein DMG08_13090 [Acidobacteriota bacterium]
MGRRIYGRVYLALLVDTKFTKWSNFCVIAGAGSEFSLQAALVPGRLKPELQTGRATMASWHGRPGHDTKLDRFVSFVCTKWS